MSGALYRYNFLKGFRDVYSASVISTVELQMYVHYFPIADHLICDVPVISIIPGPYAMVFEGPRNVFGLIF
jgi:hypothetical protein